jgi:hypothetical protein
MIRRRLAWAPTKKIEDRQALAVNNLADALGLEAIQLSADEIIFKLKGATIAKWTEGTCPQLHSSVCRTTLMR